MSEAIPLRPTLGIQGIQIVVSHILDERLDLMFEFLAMESRDFGDVQWKTMAVSASSSFVLFPRGFVALQRYHLPRLDLCRCGFDASWSEEV